jgi:hypothetical protein
VTVDRAARGLAPGFSGGTTRAHSRRDEMGRECGVGLLIAVWLLMVASMGGCVPSKEAKSAGEIGCTPENISISNEQTQFGLIQSGQTWVAECQGRTFVCSQINGSGDDQDFFDRQLASKQVSCRETLESVDKRNRQTQETLHRVQPNAPKGAAGFEFGETAEEAGHRCEAAGRTWRTAGSPDATTKAGCSGPVASLGIDASVDVGFCAGRVCSIALQHVPRSHFIRTSIALKANIETKYGSAQDSSGKVPEHCRSEQAFTHCLESQQVALHYSWTWKSGESIEMSVGKPYGAEHTAIRLVYRNLSGVNVSAL